MKTGGGVVGVCWRWGLSVTSRKVDLRDEDGKRRMGIPGG